MIDGFGRPRRGKRASYPFDMNRTVTAILLGALGIGSIAGCGAKSSLSNADKLKCQNVVTADTGSAKTGEGLSRALTDLLDADDPKLVKIGQDFDKANVSVSDDEALRDWAQKAERYCLG